MRIVLATIGTRGDVQPFLVLARELQRRGHEPVFCTPPDFVEWLAAQGFEAHAAGSPFRVLVAKHGANILGAIPTLRDEMAPQLAALDPLVRGAQLVIASGLCGAAHPLAEKYGVPYRFMALTPSLLPSREYPSPNVRSQKLPQWLNAASWTVHSAVWSAIFRAPTIRHRAALGLGPPGELWTALLRPEALVATDPLLAPAPGDAPVPVRQFGGFFFDDPTPLPDDVERFLAAGPAPVYVGFGSMADRDPAQTVRLLVEATKRAGVRVIVSRGWAGLRADPSEAIHVVDETSHARLFPRCAAIVHHGGSGTTHAAARAGVPQLVVSHLLDQFFWAERVRVAGIGPAGIARDALSSRSLGDSMRRLVEDRALADKARSFGAAMIQDGPQRAADALERIAATA